MTQDEFARHVQTSQSTVSKWETGAQLPNQRQAFRLFDELRSTADPADQLVMASVEQSDDLRVLRTEDRFLLAASTALADRLGLTQPQCRWFYVGDRLSEHERRCAAAIAEAGFFRGEVAYAEYAAPIGDALGRPRFHAVGRLFPVRLSTLEIVAMMELREISAEEADAVTLRVVADPEPAPDAAG